MIAPWLALPMCGAGLAACCVSIERNRLRLSRGPGGRLAPLAWRTLGIVFLGLALKTCIVAGRPGAGVATWFGMLTLCSMAIAIAFAFFPRLTVWLFLGAGLASLLLGMVLR